MLKITKLLLKYLENEMLSIKDTTIVILIRNLW